MIFRLVTLGDLRLTDSSGRTVPYPEKALITICYLLAARTKERSRADIAQFLWEDVDAARASANLRTLLSRVKNQQNEFGVDLLVVHETTVELNDAAFVSDLGFIEAAGDDPVARLAAFQETCRGPFMAGADDFSERGQLWVIGQREAIVSRFINALDAVTALDLAKHGELVRESAFRLLQIDPHCEDAYRSLMLAYAATGQRNQARAIYERCRSRLWTDLQALPEQSTIDLHERLSRVHALPRAAAPAEPVDSRNRYLAHLPRIVILPPLDAGTQSLLPALLEDVTLGLCSFKTMATVAPHTAWRIAADEDRGAAYARHRISYVLDTAISKHRGEEALFVQLIDVRNDASLWAERFDASVDVLLRHYQAIARRIAGSVADRVEENELQRLGAIRQSNAYQHYLEGQSSLKRLDLPDIRKARKAFRQAVREEPGFPAALAGLARTDHLEWLLTARGDADLLKSSEDYAAQAIKMETGGASGYRELGVAKLFQHQFDESIEAFEKAEFAAPCHADLISDYADTLVHASDPVRGLEKINQAIELNPLAPDGYHWIAAGANYCLERFEEALACLSRMEDQSHISRIAAACWGMLGDRKKAHAYKRKTMAMHPEFDIETWLSIMPVREQWQKDQYRDGLKKAGFN